jgi:hypothetical protein
MPVVTMMFTGGQRSLTAAASFSPSMEPGKSASVKQQEMSAYDPKRTCANAREVVIARILDAVAPIGSIVQPDENQCTQVQAEGLTPKMILQSTITCPNCGSVKTETMQTDACQYFYNCASCGGRLKPKTGDCCVFCSYGDVPCPPIQAERTGETGVASCCAG